MGKTHDSRMPEMKRVIQKFFFDLFIRGWSVATCTNCAVITLINPLSSLSPSFLLGSSSIPPPSRRALLMPQKVSMKRKWVTLLPFAEDFTVNLRIPAALRSNPGIRRDSAVLFSLPRGSWERKEWSGATREESTIFPIVESFPTIRVTRVRFYPSTRKAELIRLGHSYSTSHPNRNVRQTFISFKHLSFTLRCQMN